MIDKTPRSWRRIALPTGALLALLLLAACDPVRQVGTVATAGSALVTSVTGAAELSATPAELRQLQLRDVAAPKATAFAGVTSVLLDMGYRVQSADIASGLITAVAGSSGRLRLDPSGLARSTHTPVVSVFIEERTPSSSRVRANFSVGTSASGQLASSGERPVLDGELYASFFALLETELADRRQAGELREPVVPVDLRQGSTAGAENAAVPSGVTAPAAGQIEPLAPLPEPVDPVVEESLEPMGSGEE
jgi:hypothetical protein